MAKCGKVGDPSCDGGGSNPVYMNGTPKGGNALRRHRLSLSVERIARRGLRGPAWGSSSDKDFGTYLKEPTSGHTSRL